MFGGKIKIFKFAIKNALFGYYFGARVWKQYCHIWNHHPRIRLVFSRFLDLGGNLGSSYPTILVYPRICRIAKFCERTKMLKFGTKNALFGYSWARILKSYCHSWNQHPQICQKWVFNSYSEFWCRVHLF